MKKSYGVSDKFSMPGRGIMPGMRILYLDTWFLVNLLCDYLLCLLTARCAGLYLRRGRYALAALLGAGYACAAYLPGCGLLTLPGSKLLCGAAMGWIAFGGERQALRCILLFFAVAAGFGGALKLLSGANGGALPFSFRVLILSFLFCYGLGTLLFRWHSLLREGRVLPVTVEHAGKRVRFRALHDTGNLLRDPLTGAGVMVASPEILRPLLGESAALFSTLDAAALLERSREIPSLCGKLRLLPYSAVGQSTALLPLFRPDRVVIDGKARPDVLLAISPQAVGDGFEAIL